MLRSGLGHDFIDRASRRDRLEQFLELAFRVHVDRFFHELRQVRRGLFENKFSRRHEVAVQVDRAHERFERIRQRRIPEPAAARFFAAAHHQVFS